MADEQEQSREEKIAAARAKVEALKQQRAAQQAAGHTGAPAAGERAGGGVEVPVSAANPGGRPVDKTQGKQVRVYGTVNQAVDIVSGPEDQENLRKLLVGISGYQNPLRSGAMQVDYRYYGEARRRLEQAGYIIEEADYMGRSLKEWTAETRGWTLVRGN